MRRDHQVVPGAAQCRTHAADHRCAVAEDFLVRIKDEADHVGASGAQPLRRAIRQIADIFGRLAHADAGFERNLGIVGERPRYGRDRKLGQFGDGLQRRFLLGCIAGQAVRVRPRRASLLQRIRVDVLTPVIPVVKRHSCLLQRPSRRPVCIVAKRRKFGKCKSTLHRRKREISLLSFYNRVIPDL